MMIFFVYDNIKILHQNIAGLLSKSSNLTVCLEELASEKTLIDIICITEHFMQSGHEDLISIPNFRLAAHFSRNLKKRGGACILTRTGLDFKELCHVAKQSISGVLECCAIELINLHVIIVCIYRVPQKNDASKYFNLFFDRMHSILNKLCNKRNKKIIVCGDFNIDLLKKGNNWSKELISFFQGFNMKLELNTPTRKEKTCIDNFAHNVLRGCKGRVIEFGLSDHTSQLLQVPVKKTCRIKAWTVKKRKFSPENLNRLATHMQCLTFSEMYAMDDCNEAYNTFLNDFLMIYNLCFPLEDVKVKSTKTPKWVSKGIKQCSKNQRELLWHYRRNPSEINKTKLKTYTSTFRKIIKLTQKAQNNYFINNSDCKSKAGWKIINDAKSNLPKETILKIKTESATITDPQQIANAFNDYFIDQTSNRNDSHNQNPSTNNNLLNSMFLAPTVPEDIIKIIRLLKNKNSVGYDEIHTKAIKQVAEIIAPHLSFLINMCIHKGQYPDKLKSVVVKPLFKKDDRCSMKFYRPIALVTIFSKIFEKVIYNALESHLNKYNILTDEQMGFRKHKSIDMAIYNFLNTVLPNIDSRIPICAIYMDLTKAFDYVNHNLLLSKLNTYGVRGNVLKLIESYLSKRPQCTEISRICLKTKSEQKYLSNTREISCGVPQGSVLGPLLFIIYINDLPRHVPNPMILFADDSTVTIKFNNNYDEYLENTNDTLKYIMTWLNNNKLMANLSKTKIMHFFQRTNAVPNFSTEFEGEYLEEVKQTKFLGVQIDHQLTWKAQTSQVCQRLHKASYLLFKLSKIVSRETVLTAYHGLVASILRYGIIFWGNSTDKDTVFKAQKRCVRAICGLKPHESCAPVFKALKLLTLPSHYIYEVAVFVKNNLNLFVKVSHGKYKSVRVQNKHNLCVRQAKTALMQKNILCMAPKIYNKLPNSIKDMTLLTFKRTLFKLLVTKCYYDVQDFINDKSI